MGYVVCGACSARIPPSNWNQEFPAPCPMCSQDVNVMVFPVALRQVQVALPERVVTGEEASCYNHASNRAMAACESCGRFLCALCHIETAGGASCPTCFERLQAPAMHERVNYDSIALALVTLPMLLCWMPIVTTPVALFFAFKFWNAPSQVFPRGKWRLWLTVIIALAQVAAVAGLIVFVLRFGGGGLPRE